MANPMTVAIISTASPMSYPFDSYELSMGNHPVKSCDFDMRWSMSPLFELRLKDISPTGKVVFPIMKGSLYSRIIGVVAIIGGAAALGLTTAAPAVAAPSNPSAQETIDKLKADGYNVIVAKVGNNSVDQCTVSAVRDGHDVKNNWIIRGPAGQVGTQTRYTTVYVDLHCKDDAPTG